MTQPENEQIFGGGGVLEQWTKSPAANELAQILQALETIQQHIQTPLSPIKSIQRGITTEATTITIDAVDMTKAVVLSVGKKSEGYAPVSANLNSSGGATANGYKYGYLRAFGYANAFGVQPAENSTYYPPGGNADYPAIFNQSGSVSGGTTNGGFATKQFSGRLTSETTLQCDGAVEWQVIEYN